MKRRSSANITLVDDNNIENTINIVIRSLLALGFWPQNIKVTVTNAKRSRVSSDMFGVTVIYREEIT